MKVLFHFAFAGLVTFSALPGKSQVHNEVLINPKHEEWRREAPGIFKVKITTTKGFFVIEVQKGWAPKGANRFYNLVRMGFFDDSRFYRVREGSFAQFGIPGKPEIAKVWEHEAIQDDPAIESNRKGTIAYAMTGPNARTTQLYINLKDNTELDKQGFEPIGAVTEGLEVVMSLYAGYAEAAGGGMRAGKQGKLFEEGNTYLDREFSKLDKLLKAEIIK